MRLSVNSFLSRMSSLSVTPRHPGCESECEAGRMWRVVRSGTAMSGLGASVSSVVVSAGGGLTGGTLISVMSATASPTVEYL